MENLEQLITILSIALITFFSLFFITLFKVSKLKNENNSLKNQLNSK